MNKSVNEWSPIHISTRWSSKHALIQLLSIPNIDLYAESVNGTQAHHFTANSGNLSLTLLLIKKGLDPMKTDRLGDNIAHQAAACLTIYPEYRSIKLLNYIYDHYPSLLYDCDEQGRSPLHISCAQIGRCGSTKIMEFLLRKRLQLRKKDIHGLIGQDLIDNGSEQYENAMVVIRKEEEKREEELQI